LIKIFSELAMAAL